MRILVTGHAGFIGSNLYEHLVAAGHHVTGWEWGHISQPVVEGMDCVIHIGAISATTERDVERLMEQNTEFSIDLLDRCIEAGVNFQYASSASVYGSRTDFREYAPKDPRSGYAWSKFVFDRHVERIIPRLIALPMSDPRRIRIHGFRYFNVFGLGEERKLDMASPVTKFRIQAQETGLIKIFDDSESYLRDFVCVTDICRAHELFLTENGANGIYNIGTGRATDFASIAGAIAAKTGAEVVRVPMPEALVAQYQRYTCADMRKFRAYHPDFQWMGVLDWIDKYVEVSK